MWDLFFGSVEFCCGSELQHRSLCTVNRCCCFDSNALQETVSEMVYGCTSWATWTLCCIEFISPGNNIQIYIKPKDKLVCDNANNCVERETSFNKISNSKYTEQRWQSDRKTCVQKAMNIRWFSSWCNEGHNPKRCIKFRERKRYLQHLHFFFGFTVILVNVCILRHMKYKQTHLQ